MYFFFGSAPINITGCKFPDIRYLVVLLSSIDKCAPDASKSLALFSPFLRYYYSRLQATHYLSYFTHVRRECFYFANAMENHIIYHITIYLKNMKSSSLQIGPPFIYDRSTQQQISLRQNAMSNIVRPTSSSKRKESGISRTPLEVLLSLLRLLPNPPEHSYTNSLSR